MIKFMIFIFAFGSVSLLASQIVPLIIERLGRVQAKKISQAEKQLAD